MVKVSGSNIIGLKKWVGLRTLILYIILFSMKMFHFLPFVNYSSFNELTINNTSTVFIRVKLNI